MLERQRRARINRCLDELKELMSGALASEGENMAKFEKADVLELTVRHLHKLRRESRLAVNPVVSSDRFRAGFTQCAREVSVCLAAIPGVDISLGTRLMTHLGHALNHLEQPQQPQQHHQQHQETVYSPPSSPLCDVEMPSVSRMSAWRPESPSSSSGYGSDNNRTAVDDEEIDVGSDAERVASSASSNVWRPW